MKISGKSFFVTGADGFIGSHLVELLVKHGAKIKALVFYNSWNEIGWLKVIPKNILDDIEIIKGDVRDCDQMQEIIRGCEFVMHLSSLIAIPYSYNAPRSYIDTNILGTLNVLQGCRRSDNFTKLVHVSTSETYGSAKFTPINENHPLSGQSPYSASKIGADKLVESFNLTFDLPVVTARPFNTFGPRQTARAVIPTIASQLASGNEEIKLGALSPTRDFNYVTDTAAGMIELAISDNTNGEVVNIGSGEEWSIKQTAELLLKISGKKAKIVIDEVRLRPENSEVDRLIADNSKISKLTNWKSNVSFYDGLNYTYDWVEKNIHLFDANSYTR